MNRTLNSDQFPEGSSVSPQRAVGAAALQVVGDATHLRLTALGTEVNIAASDPFPIASELHRLAALLTRFQPSQLSQLNHDGRLVNPPVELLEALRWAVEAARYSNGLVTPLIGRSMEWHGYRRSWPLVESPGPGRTPPPVPSLDQLVITDREVVLPDGAALDLGGSAKSWIVERVAPRMPSFVIDAGGDVLVDLPAEFELELCGAEASWHLRLPAGRWGVATSSIARRAWRGAHHLIDPRSGRPAVSRWRQATAVCRSLRHAEIVTKLLIFGAPLPAALGTERAWVVDAEGQLHAWRPEGNSHVGSYSFSLVS